MNNIQFFKALKRLWEAMKGRVAKQPAYQLVPVRVQRRRF